MKRKNLLFLLLALLFAPWAANAQDLADYTFSTGTSETQWITLSDGLSSIVSANDDSYSALTDIGFSFPFGDGTYTKFWANANGIFSFSSSPTNNYSNQFTSSNLSANQPKICGITRDMGVPSNGGYVKYELTGTAPNRVLVCEFNLQSESGSSSTPTVNFQVQLHENGSKVVLVYGAAATLSSFQIGLSQSTSDVWTVDPSTHKATHSTGAVSQTYSTWPGANRYYAFERPVWTCFKPTGLAATLTPGNGRVATLNWTENGTATSWVLEYGTASDFTGATSEIVSGTPTKNLTGLTAEQTYYARVKPDCDTDGSKWSATCEFTPTNALTITVADGTVTNTDIPLDAYSSDTDGSTGEFIIPATQLSSIAGADITEITFYPTSGPNLSDCDYQVYMKEVEGTTLSSTYGPGSCTVVYTGALDCSGAKMTITLDESYTYNGGNLLIGTYLASKGSYQSDATFKGITATGAAYASGTYNGYNDGVKNFIPKTTLSYTINTFPKPKNLTVSNVTNNSATVAWEAPTTATPTGYKYQYKPEGGEWTTLTSTTALSAPLSGLTANTNYTFQVKAIYSEGESEFVAKTFTTECNAFPIPYPFGFEAEEIADLNCWTIFDVYGRAYVSNNTASGEDYARTGEGFFIFTYQDYPDTNPQYMTLISPELTGINNGLHVEFYYHTDGQSSYPETFRVGYSTTNTDLSSFTWVNTITDAVAADYQLFKANYPAGTKFVAVQHLSDDMDFLVLDDFSFTEAPSCTEPSNLQVSNITTSGAALSWTIGGEATSWDIYVTDDDTDVPDDETTPTYAGVTSNTNYPISSLTSGTTYYVYVRSACDATTHSDWTMPTSFNTACEAISLPYQYDFEDDVLPVCWNTIGTNSGWITSFVSSTAPQHGSKHFVIQTSNYATGTQYVVLPEVDANYPLNEYEITFYSELAGYTTTGRTLAVGVMTDPTDASTFVQIGDAFTPSTTYEQYKVRLNTYTGSGHYIAIKHVITSGPYYASYTYIDNLEVNHLPACLEPSDPVVSNITNHTAKVDWTGTSAAYNIDYRTAAGNDGSMLNQNFNSLTTDNTIPTGWDNSEGTVTTESYKWSYNTYTSGNGATNGTSHDGSKCVRFNSFNASSDQTNFLKTPAMNFPSGKTMQLTFWWKNPTGGDFSVYISTDGGTTKTDLKTGMTGQSTWKQETITLTDYVGASNVTIHFKGTSNWGYGDAYIYLDDVVIGENVPAGDWQHTTATTNTKTLEGLLASKKYDVRVQGDCGDQGTSVWSGIVSFTTDIPCPAPSSLAFSNEKSDKVDLSWTNGGSADWIVAYKLSTDADFTEVDVATADVTIEGNTVTYTLTGLRPEMEYNVKVKDNCEASYAGDGTSDWTNTVTFTTLEACGKPTGVAASNIGHYTAQVDWTGDSPYFTVQYRTAASNDDSMLNADFTGLTSGIPTGWDNTEGTTSSDYSKWQYYDSGHNAAPCMRFNSYSNSNGNTNFLKTPSMDFPAGKTMQLTFWWKNPTGGDFSVYISTDGGTNKTLLKEGMTGQSTWKQETFSLESYAGNANVTIHFKGTSNYGSGDAYIYLDDVVIGEVIPAGEWQTLSPNPTTTTANLTGLTAGQKYEVTVAPSCDNTQVSDIVDFTTVSADEKWFITEGNWDVAANWEPAGAPTINQDVVLKANATIASGEAFAKSIAGTGNGSDAKTLTIESGAKLKHLNNNVRATVKKTINGYGAGNEAAKADYYLIAQPLTSAISNNTISSTNMLNGKYDLYNWSYNSNDGNEWRNYEVSSFSLSAGAYGYLYANEATTTLTFTGTVNPYTGNKSRNLSATTSTSYDFPSWYLLGNPYLYDAYLANSNSATATALPYYRMNEDGNGFDAVAATSLTPIAPMEGFFYQATSSGYVYVTTTAPSVPNAGLLNMSLRSGNKKIDNAIVTFGDEQRLEKLSFREGSSKIYMPVENKDYAIVNAESNVGEMPVSFKAENNGSYTLSFNTENIEFGYLHLIDNMTGADVDLLETPSYSFEAKTTDYASRFKLVFAAGSNANDESFAFMSDGNLIVNNEGEATLQVIDVNGRILRSESINGSASINMNTVPGVYMIRVINGNDVKVQKVVVR